MNITRNLIVAVLMTVVTTLLLGVVYPLAVTGLAQVLFPDKANGQLIERDGKIVGSRIIGQGFSSGATSVDVRQRPEPVTIHSTRAGRTSGRRTRSSSTRWRRRSVPRGA